MYSNQLMEAWLGEYSNWRTEEEENQEFASVLCGEFQNWITAQEEEESYNQGFLTKHFDQLPTDVIRIVRQIVWRKQIQKQQTVLPFGFSEAPALSKAFLKNWYYYQFYSCQKCQTERSCERCKKVRSCS